MKKTTLLLAFLFILTTLTGCSTTIDGNELSGINVIWVPVYWIWHWLWSSFTPGFWEFMRNVWDVPASISWLAGPIAYILGGLLYILIAIIIIVADIVLAIVTGLLYFLLAVLNGIFHWQ
jgi:hypothetical protein